MTTAILFNGVTTAQNQTQDLTDDQLEMISGGHHGGPHGGRQADPSGFCEDLRWVLPEQDLPSGCK